MLRIDECKIGDLIERFLKEVDQSGDGGCISTGACIGMVDGKQIQLCVKSDEDDFMSVCGKFCCVEEVE